MSTTSAVQAAATSSSTDPNSSLEGYPHDNLKHVVITSTCFAFILSTFSVGFRILSRKINGRGLYLDDFFILGGLLFLYGISAAGVVLLYHGLGQHIQYVSARDLVIYEKVLFTGSFLYPGCIVCIKLSILALYRRLFPTKLMLTAIYTVGMIVILWGLSVCLVGAFICIPVRKLWDPTVTGGCLNLAEYYYGLQIPNILTDAIILVMPMRVVWGLPISTTQKSLLSGIFVVGTVTLVFDIVRLVAMIDLSKKGDDATYNQVTPSVWTCIEPAVGITAACLSNMRPLFKAMYRDWVNLKANLARRVAQRTHQRTHSESHESLRTQNPEQKSEQNSQQSPQLNNSAKSRWTDGSNTLTNTNTNTLSPDQEKQEPVSPRMEA